jgi:integrase
MASEINPTTTTVAVFTRHSADCPKAADRYWRRCKCRKSLYIYADGKATFVSAKTRSWEQAETYAHAERDRRDPVKQRLMEIEAVEAEKTALQESKNLTVVDATDRWLKSLTRESHVTEVIRGKAARRIMDWALDVKIPNVRDIRSDALDLWRGTWAPDAEKVYSRIGQTSQSHFQGRLKNFCRWCVAPGNLERDPSALLQPIRLNDVRTQPLTPAQFNELLAAVDPFIAEVTGVTKEYALELKALFLLQRWAGLRILDCLMLPRTGLVGNRLSLTTEKTGAKIENRTVPDCVVEALGKLLSDRPGFRPGYYFWREGRKSETLSTQYDIMIQKLNAYLNFNGEDGQPLPFHSHMLRDTYAVELLLAGVSLEDVSKLLTHTSIKTTQDHYAPWVKSRLPQLDDKVVAAMRGMGAAVSA